MTGIALSIVIASAFMHAGWNFLTKNCVDYNRYLCHPSAVLLTAILSGTLFSLAGRRLPLGAVYRGNHCRLFPRGQSGRDRCLSAGIYFPDGVYFFFVSFSLQRSITPDKMSRNPINGNRIRRKKLFIFFNRKN